MKTLTCAQCLTAKPVAELSPCTRCHHNVCSGCQLDHEAKHVVNDDKRRR